MLDRVFWYFLAWILVVIVLHLLVHREARKMGYPRATLSFQTEFWAGEFEHNRTLRWIRRIGFSLVFVMPISGVVLAYVLWLW